MVAGHVGFDECVAAAVETLSRGLPLASFGCSKCGASHLDADKFATKLHSRLGMVGTRYRVPSVDTPRYQISVLDT